MRGFIRRQSGGVARSSLDHRLMAPNPPGSENGNNPGSGNGNNPGSRTGNNPGSRTGNNAGSADALFMQSGGVARSSLDHRLMAPNPPGSENGNNPGSGNGNNPGLANALFIQSGGVASKLTMREYRDSSERSGCGLLKCWVKLIS
jgi:hypothetical protein